MRRFLFMVAMVLMLSSCDNTKMRLRAPASESTPAIASTEKSDTIVTDSLKKDKVIIH